MPIFVVTIAAGDEFPNFILAYLGITFLFLTTVVAADGQCEVG